MSALIAGKLPNEHKINSEKYLTHNVCFNHLFNTKCTPIELIKLVKIKCMI